MITNEHLIEAAYLVATALFVLSLKWMSSPATARRGVWAGELGMLLAIVGTLLHHGIVEYKWIAIALVLGSIIGAALGRVQMTAVPQRTALSHAFGALCVTLVGTAEYYLQAPDVPAFHDGGALGRGDPGLAHIHRQPDGRRQAAGNLAPAADHLQRGQNIVNLSLLFVSVGVAVFMVFHPGPDRNFSHLAGDSHAFRHADDHPDRRCRHADGDLALEFVRGPVGRGDGLCAQ